MNGVFARSEAAKTRWKIECEEAWVSLSETRWWAWVMQVLHVSVCAALNKTQLIHCINHRADIERFVERMVLEQLCPKSILKLSAFMSSPEYALALRQAVSVLGESFDC